MEAVLRHDGEGRSALDRMKALPASAIEELLAFLQSL